VATQEKESKMVADAKLRISAKVAVAEILAAAGGPMASQDIIEKVLAHPHVELTGKTPRSTIAAILSTESRKEDGMFVKVDRATYAIRPA
jgi:hypothetical protein